MKSPMLPVRRAALPWVSIPLLAACAAGPDMTTTAHPLAGTWTLVAADAIRPDGTRIRDYGEAPKGMLLVDAAGRYSLQIFKAERPRFASANKGTATPAEYASAVMGSSTHFGEITVDPAGSTLTFAIAASSFPNWEGTKQTRGYELQDGVLSYRVPPRADGNVPVSVWKKIR